MVYVTTFAAGLTAALLLMSAPTNVHGQEVSVLEEVVVTARRREENLQEVPVAITAISSEELELRSIENTKDLQMLLPNVDIRGNGINSAAAGSITIRGIPGVARYIDGVHLSGNQSSLENVLELERIEVLRGPQGTYFGKNAIGGAIQYITLKPQEEFGARVKVTLGEFNRTDVIVNVDIPFSDTVLTKLTAASLTRDGYVDSVNIDETYGEVDNTIIRGMLQWEPTDSFSALFTAENNQHHNNMQANVLFDVIEGVTFGPRTPEQYNNFGVPFTDDLYAFGNREEYKNASDYTGPGFDFDADSVSAHLTWDINDSITFRSITAYREFDWSVFRDNDATNLVYFDVWAYEVVDETTQEFQLLGNGDRYTWVAGLYYYEEEELAKFQSWQRVEVAGAPGAPSPRLRNTMDLERRTDTALYAEFSYDLTDQLTLTVGGRYSEEDFHSETYVPTEPIGPPGQVSFNLDRTIQIVGGEPLVRDVSFDAFTPRLALQYQWTPNIMGYVSVAQGFNGGGVNARFDPTLPNNGILPFDDELLTNVELGLRSDLLDNRLRLNVTYFTGVWEDIQIVEILTPGQGTTTNAGEADIEGLEIEGMWKVTDAFSLNFTAGWLDTEYTDIGLATLVDLGTPFPFAPETSYSIGLQWDNDLSSGGSITTRLDYGWIDDFETFRDKRFQISLAANDGYGLLSGRFIYTPAEGNWDVAVFGTNLTDEYYRLGGFAAVLAGIDDGVVARPREIGVTLRLRL